MKDKLLSLFILFFSLISVFETKVKILFFDKLIYCALNLSDGKPQLKTAE